MPRDLVVGARVTVETWGEPLTEHLALVDVVYVDRDGVEWEAARMVHRPTGLRVPAGDIGGHKKAGDRETARRFARWLEQIWPEIGELSELVWTRPAIVEHEAIRLAELGDAWQPLTPTPAADTEADR